MRASAKAIVSIWFAVFTASVAAADMDGADETPSTPREQAISNRLEGITKIYLGSSDIALRAMYSINGLDRLPDKTVRVHEDIPIATLVEQARGSTDPLLLDVLLQRCELVTTCDRMELATRWVQADTQNQLAWLTLATVQKERGDPSAARETFLRAARASTWHGHWNEGLQRAVRAIPPDLTAPERSAALTLVYGKAGMFLPFKAIHALGEFCKEPDAMRQACAQIVATAARDCDDLFTMNVTTPFAARAGVSKQILAGYQQTSDAIHWAQISMAGSSSLPNYDVEDSLELRATIRQIDARIAQGERRSAEQYLLAQHVTEAEAASRYVGGLHDSARKNRAEMLSKGS